MLVRHFSKLRLKRVHIPTAHIQLCLHPPLPPQGAREKNCVLNEMQRAEQLSITANFTLLLMLFLSVYLKSPSSQVGGFNSRVYAKYSPVIIFQT